MIEDYRGFGLQVHTTDISPIQSLGGMTSFGIDNRPQVSQDQAGDNVYPVNAYVTGFEQSLRFTTTNIAKYLSIFGATANCIKGTDGVNSGFDFYAAHWDDCSNGIASGSVHRKYALPVDSASADKSVGLIVPESISVNHRGNAQITAMLHYKGSDVGANRLTITENNALPATIADDGYRYTLWKAVLESTECTGMKSWNVQFNSKVIKESADSKLYPERIGLNGMASMVTIDGVNPKWVDSLAPIGGKQLTHANTSFYFRRRDTDSDGQYDATTDAVHLKLTTAGLLIPTNLISNQVNQIGKSAASIWTKYDGTNAPLLFTPNQQIP